LVEQITNGKIVDESRKGWVVDCTKCSRKIKYTILNIEPGVDVYLYCDKCSDFCLREEDRVRMIQTLNVEGVDAEAAVSKMYEWLESALPSCGCGGNFKLWANIKCQSCGQEIPYNNGVKDFKVRSRESKIVWTESSIAYRGKLQPSNRLVEVITGS